MDHMINLFFFYFVRSMLSAAHVLAMDAKNLLDVIDSIRTRYPELFLRAPLHPSQSLDHATCPQSAQIVRDMPQSDANAALHHFAAASPAEDSYDMMQRQTYQNLSEITDQSASHVSPEMEDGGEELYANQQQLDQQGIYDNDCMISTQLNKLNVAGDTPHYASAVDSIVAPKISPLPPAKPPVAAKPVNLQQKLKANLATAVAAPSAHTNECNAVAAAAANSAEDSLKIVEHEHDLYSNANAKATE